MLLRGAAAMIHYGQPSLPHRRLLLLVVALAFPVMYMVFKMTMNHQSQCLRRVESRLSEAIDSRLSRDKFYFQKIKTELNAFRSRHHSRREPVFVSAASKENLGNYLFMIASLVGISKKNDRIPVIRWPRKDYITAITGLSLIPVIRNNAAFRDRLEAMNKFRENGTEKFSPEAFHIAKNYGTNSVFIFYYLQSWKYFDYMRNEIRALLAFNEAIFRKASAVIVNEIKKQVTMRSLGSEPQLVGVHVRRGDILFPKYQSLGYQTASDDYLLRTVSLVEGYARSTIFVVVSNDLPYCKNLFNGTNFVFLDGHSRMMDMAVLTLMDRLILTVGTFGWWSAYLSDAETIFHFKRPFRQNTKLSAILNSDDFFYPDWYGSA